MKGNEYPLWNCRVVDWGWVAAGPSATKILADMGAEVIKVETRNRPDTTRFTNDNVERSPETDPVFHALNRNKLGITVDMSKIEGTKLLKKLVKVSDIVVENFVPGVMKRFGLDYESLRQEKPDLIMVSMPGIGNLGPLANTPAYAPSIAALSGLTSMEGYYGERPMGMQQPYSDYSAGVHAACAILAALIHRKHTGEGQYIEVAELEALISCLGEPMLYYQVSGKVPGTMGNRHDIMAPHNNYRCKGEDNWVSIAVKTNKEWDNFIHITDIPKELRSKKFSSRKSRLNNIEKLDDIITSWTINYTPKEVTDILQNAGVAAFPCMDIEDCFLDPHFQEREVFVSCTHPVMGEEIIPNLSWRMSETQGPIYRSAPLLGEHNKYILHDILGLSDDEIVVLNQKGVLQ